MTDTAVDRRLAEGSLESLEGAALERFVADGGLGVLLLGECDDPFGEGHDVAVALRELLREAGGRVRGGLVAAPRDRAVQQRQRVSVLPSLVFVKGGEVLEVVPRVRDWAEYTLAFQRYLGVPVRVVRAPAEAAEVRS